MIVQPPKLERIAVLPDSEWRDLWYAVDLINAGMREIEMPAALHARMWRLLRQCGAGVQSFDTLRLMASSLHCNRLTIERLRAYQQKPSVEI